MTSPAASTCSVAAAAEVLALATLRLHGETAALPSQVSPAELAEAAVAMFAASLQCLAAAEAVTAVELLQRLGLQLATSG